MNKERLSVCLFGPHLFYLDGGPCCLRIRGKTLELLRYLILHAGREIRREFIADLLWRNSSERQQRSAMNSAIWRIGKKLPRHPGISLHVSDSTIRFEIDDLGEQSFKGISEPIRILRVRKAMDRHQYQQAHRQSPKPTEVRPNSVAVCSLRTASSGPNASNARSRR